MIKLFETQDIQEVLKIEQSLFDRAWSYDNFYDAVTGLLHCCITYKSDGIIIGYAIAQLLCETEAEILKITVSKEYQGRGIGKTLLKHIIGICSKKNITTIFLEVSTTNTSAVNLYKSAGFKQLGIRKNYYGEGKDAFNFVLELI